MRTTWLTSGAPETEKGFPARSDSEGVNQEHPELTVPGIKHPRKRHIFQKCIERRQQPGPRGNPLSAAR